MKTTKIEWTDITWNPVTGCSKRSIGCANCYAEIMARRLCAMGQEKYKNGFQLTMHAETLNEPFSWKNPHTIFICSMSDLFHEKVSFSFIDKVLETVEATPQHRYQLLTKRDKRMAKYFETRKIPDNVWLGVTVEAKSTKDRINTLRNIPASIRFVSCEPLLEDLGEIDFSNIHWVIVGGESGKRARPMQEDWVLSIEDQVVSNGSAFFFKQWGTWGEDGKKRSKYANGKLLKGVVRQELPI